MCDGLSFASDPALLAGGMFSASTILAGANMHMHSAVAVCKCVAFCNANLTRCVQLGEPEQWFEDE